MTGQIPLEQVLKLVSFVKRPNGTWKVLTVYDDVHGDVRGNVHGDVSGDVRRHVWGDVFGKINDRKWEFVETPLEKLERLIQESGDQELIEAFNQQQQEDN